MGYRSEVSSLIYGPEDRLKAFITEQRLISNGLSFDYLNKHIKLFSSEEKGETIFFIHLHVDDIKWYSDYEDIQKWYQLLESAEKFGLHTEFARAGEEPTDLEYEGENYRINFGRPAIYTDIDTTNELKLF